MYQYVTYISDIQCVTSIIRSCESTPLITIASMTKEVFASDL